VCGKFRGRLKISFTSSMNLPGTPNGAFTAPS
jgi:hypothetical protein